MNSSGVVITPVGTFCATVGGATDLSPDGSGNAWTNGSLKIVKVDATGALAASAPNSASCFYPQAWPKPRTPLPLPTSKQFRWDMTTSATIFGDSRRREQAQSQTAERRSSVTSSATLPVILPFGPPSTGSPWEVPYVGNSLLITSGVLDGAGNLWYLTSGTTENGVVGSSFGTFSGTATFSTYLNGISPSGALLTPYNAGSKIYGNQPSGVGANGSATASNAFASNVSGNFGGLLGVDNWVEISGHTTRPTRGGCSS